MQKLGDFKSAHTLSDQELMLGIEHVHTTEAELAAARLAMLTEAHRRGLANKPRSATVKRWYAETTRVHEGTAKHHIDLGYWLEEHPTVAESLCSGAIHEAHTKAIAEGIALVLRADNTLSESAQADAIEVLLNHAAHSTARAVSERAQELANQAADDAKARYDERKLRWEKQRREKEGRDKQDSAGPDDKETPGPADPDDGPDPEPPGPPPIPISENTDLNKLGIYILTNGRSKIDGDLDKLTAEKLLTALSPLSAPEPSPDGTRDERSRAQRNADGLNRLLDRYLAEGRPAGSGNNTDVVLLVELADLMKKNPCRDDGSERPGNREDCGSSAEDREDRSTGGAGSGIGNNRDNSSPDTGIGNEDSGLHHKTGGDMPGPHDPDWPFHLGWTGPISSRLAEFLSCDAALTPVIVDDAGIPLALGRSSRFPDAGLRRAVTIRDRCCVKCGRPADWCQTHHIVYWHHGGPTDLDNLALVCTECHREIHNTDWELAMGEDGHPYLIPPVTEDPDRKPIPSYHRRRTPSA